MAKSPTSEVIKLKHVRLSFADLYKAKAFDENQEAKYKANLLLDPSNADNAVAIKTIREEAKKLLAQGGLEPADVKLCFGKGDTKKYEGYAGMVYISASNSSRPVVVNRRQKPVVDGDHEAPYGGCYVNASITLWLQDNKWGKRVNANLRSVQFVKDGPAFGVAPVDAETEFEPLEEGETSPAAGGDDDWD